MVWTQIEVIAAVQKGQAAYIATLLNKAAELEQENENLKKAVDKMNSPIQEAKAVKEREY